ncbi:MAG: glycosyltransferase [Nitrospirae bacterium]|nr:glycosyltransferase [Nitrospirota bacterium]
MIEVSYILSEGYKELSNRKISGVDYLTKSKNIKEVFIDTVFFIFRGLEKWKIKLQLVKPNIIYFYNMHPLNIILTKFARRYVANVTIILHLHEPNQPDKYYFSKKQKLIIYIQEYLQDKLVYLSDYIILPSPFAADLFRRRFNKFTGKFYIVPLCIPDEPAISYKRDYVVMTGHVYPDGRVEDFCRLLEYAANVSCSFRFRIVTSSQITAFLQKKLSEKALSLLDIVEKRPLSDKEINEHMANAFASLSMHTRGSQSGVTPVAFMNGTPIVARNIPMFNQFVEDKVNGRLVSPTAEPSEWLSAIESVRSNFEKMSKEARNSFLSIFHESKLENYLGWLIQEIRQKTNTEKQTH